VSHHFGTLTINSRGSPTKIHLGIVHAQFGRVDTGCGSNPVKRPAAHPHFTVVLLLSLVALLVTACGGGGHSSTGSESIAISASGSVAAGQSVQLHATETTAGGTTTDVTS